MHRASGGRSQGQATVARGVANSHSTFRRKDRLPKESGEPKEILTTSKIDEETSQLVK